MPEEILREKLAGATESVLETMFFTTVISRGQGPEMDAASSLRIQVQFVGSPSGQFEVVIDPHAARVMAEGFLPDAESPAMEETMREFANMACGAFLSEIETDGEFQLRPPVVVEGGGVDRASSSQTVLREEFTLDCGRLAVAVAFAGE